MRQKYAARTPRVSGLYSRETIDLMLSGQATKEVRAMALAVREVLDPGVFKRIVAGEPKRADIAAVMDAQRRHSTLVEEVVLPTQYAVAKSNRLKSDVIRAVDLDSQVKRLTKKAKKKKAA